MSTALFVTSRENGRAWRSSKQRPHPTSFASRTRHGRHTLRGNVYLGFAEGGGRMHEGKTMIGAATRAAAVWLVAIIFSTALTSGAFAAQHAGANPAPPASAQGAETP